MAAATGKAQDEDLLDYEEEDDAVAEKAAAANGEVSVYMYFTVGLF